MIPIKNSLEILKMREASLIAATVLDILVKNCKAGVKTRELDELAKQKFEEFGSKSACHNYKVGGKRYPAYTCISVNEEVVHGIPSDRLIKEGDIVAIDVSVVHSGYVGDNARTVIVGNVSPEVKKLVQVTEKALEIAISNAVPGNRIGDISHAVQNYVESNGFSVIRDMVGHGVGRSMHEEPQIPNFGKPGLGPKIKTGMTFAIEPMVNMGRYEVEYLEDGWTVVSKDRLPSAHFEHTVLITDSGQEILTKPKVLAC